MVAGGRTSGVDGGDGRRLVGDAARGRARHGDGVDAVDSRRDVDGRIIGNRGRG